MARTRRILTRSGDQFETSGESWSDDVTVDFSTQKFQTITLPPDFTISSRFRTITIWEDGFISLGAATQAQIDWVDANGGNGNIYDFPGEFAAVGYQDFQPDQFSQVRYTFGQIDFDPPFDTPIDIIRITWTSPEGAKFQFQLTSNDFALVDGRFDDTFGGIVTSVGQVGFRIDGVTFDPVQEPMAEYFFNTGLGGAYLGDDFANVLGGTTRGDRLEGLGGNDQLYGNEGDDVLIGGAGADHMQGGDGNDVYSVTSSGDRAIEFAGGGTDLIQSSINLTLPDHVERLRLLGDALNGNGNGLANLMFGNDGANRLDGRGGVDQMRGGGGNDIYRVDVATDRVVELANDGIDKVVTTVSYFLRANIEHLQLVGGAAINGTGNTLTNFIVGNDASNRLNGGEGADRLQGGGGNDSYVVDNLLDRVIELDGGGTDRVLSSVTHSLAAAVENLILTGTAPIAGTGNDLDNVLIGNSAFNRMTGAGGNDSITTGGGQDRVVFNTPLDATTNVDTITDFSAPLDTIYLRSAVFAEAGANGTLAAAAFHSGTAAHDASDRIIYDPATGEIFYDADGNGAAAAILFARADPGLALANSDFVIFG